MTIAEKVTLWRTKRAAVIALKLQYETMQGEFVTLRNNLERAIAELNQAETDLDRDPIP